MLLAIYLNDHLAGATVGRDLAKRAAGRNRNSDYGPFLERLAREVAEDRESLVAIMRALDVKIDPLKAIASWGVEKVGRLKLNGRLFGYSPLSRLVELEGITLGVYGKRALWRSLQQVDPERPAIAGRDLSELLARAERQLEELELHRQRAAVEALVHN